MYAMMLGPLFAQTLSRASTSTSISCVILVASWSLLTTLLVSSEMIVFAAFCVFEMAIGICFSSMGNLNNRLVANGMRAKVYGLLRLPLNLFVVAGHSLAEDGTSEEVSYTYHC